MDYSAANNALWNIVIQLGLIAGAILLASYLRARFAFVRKSMMPIAVLGGFLLLLCKYLGIVRIDGQLMEMLQNSGELAEELTPEQLQEIVQMFNQIEQIDLSDLFDTGN